MGTEELKHAVVFILLAFALVFSSIILITPLASSGDWVNNPEPGDMTIEVVQGENFVIRHVLEWDEPQDGSYTVTVAWDCYDNHENENFTFVKASAYFTTGDYAGESILAVVTLDSASSPDYPGSTRYGLSVSCPADNKDSRDGQFNVDITLGAYGVGGVPHIENDNHPIPYQFAGIIIIEPSLQMWNRAPTTIKVLEPPPVCGVDVTIEPKHQRGTPCTWLTFLVEVHNTGNIEDNYLLSVLPDGWPMDNIYFENARLENVQPSETKTTSLSVHIPEDAEPCTHKEIVVVAESEFCDNIDNDSALVQVVSAYLHAEGPINLNEPVCTWWHELYPNFSKRYHLTSWEDENADGLLGPSDQIGMKDNETGEVDNYHVKDVTITILISKNPVPLENKYLDFEGDFENWDNLKKDPECTQWHEIWPVFSKRYHLMSWEDENLDGALGPSDQIEMIDKETGETHWYHVDEVATDLVLCKKPPIVGPVVEVSISPEDQSDIPGKILNFEVTVSNTGIDPDNYSLEKYDNAGWDLWLDNYLLTIPAGENRKTTLHVIIYDWASSGEEDEITVTAKSVENENVSDSATCIARAFFVKGVEISSISPPENSGIPGENVTFTVTIKNTGNVPDSYNLAASDNAGWGPKIFPPSFGILAGSSRTATLSVIIPAGTASGMKDNITVKATSVTDNKLENYATCIATAATMRGVEVSISPPENSAIPGENVTFTVTVTNTGNVTDNYDLTVSDNAVPSWAPSLSKYLLENIGLGGNKTTTLTVKIPENASPGEEDEITVTAKSTENAEISGNASCIARAVVGGVEVSISPNENSAMLGENVTFTVTVTNTGEADDSYDLTISDDAGWAPLLSDNLLENIGPSGNKTTTLTVKIPENASPGEEDEITVTATSQMYPVVTDNASCMASVFIVRGVNVYLSPSENSGVPEESVTFTVTVTNTGEADDSYDLEISDTEAWGATLDDSSLSIPLGENRMTTVRVTVPSGAIENESTVITVTATSVENEDASDNATCIATAAVLRRVKVSISPPENSGPPRRTLTYQVKVTNTGNTEDTYKLEVSDNAYPGWDLIVSPDSLTVPPNSDNMTTLAVIIPDEAFLGEKDNVTVTVTSQTDNTVSDTASCIATVVVVRNVGVSISPENKSGVPRENIRFTVTVTNIGNIADTYILEVSDNADWDPAVSKFSLGIGGGSSSTATLSVVIPEGTAAGVEDEITVKATSNTDDTISDNATCIVTVAALGWMEVSITPESKSGAPGETLTFTVTVKNLGNVPDNYDLTADDNANWSLTLPQTLTNVTPGESRTVDLGVGIPGDAENNTNDKVTVTATSWVDSMVKKSASCTAHAVVAPPPPPERGVQVSVSPEDQRGSPKKTLTFTVTVKNTGEAEDSYDLIVSDDAGWGATLVQNLLTIPTGQTLTTTVRVTVPSDAADDESTNITVIATSRGDSTVSASITPRAVAGVSEGIEVELVLLATSVLLIGAAIVVAVYLLRARRKKAARGMVLRGVSWGLR